MISDEDPPRGKRGLPETQTDAMLHGRKKDLIVLANGQNVYPEDVERALKGVPGVDDAVVVGMPTEQGAVVHAVLILDKSGANRATACITCRAPESGPTQIRTQPTPSSRGAAGTSSSWTTTARGSSAGSLTGPAP